MNTINISQKTKNKHLDFSHYEYIINSLIMFNASYSGKRNIGKTQFIQNLALDVGTSVSNIYSIIKDATVSIRDTHLNEHFELSALAAFQKRSKNHKIPNNSKFDKATDFISLVENEIKSNRLSSIDETINYLIIHQRDKINDMETVSTKTFYNYVKRRYFNGKIVKNTGYFCFKHNNDEHNGICTDAEGYGQRSAYAC